MYFRFVIFLLILHLPSFGQNKANEPKEKAKIHLKKAAWIVKREDLGDNVQLLLGNVKLQHKNTIMFCDSAYIYNDSNYVEAYHNIHIIQNDSIHLYGDLLLYEGNNNMAKVRKNVKIVKKDITLTTQFLDYDRNNNVGYYYNGGEVISGENTLVSDWGYYYPDYNEVHFKDSVVVTNPKYTIFSDTLKYNTISEIASILGPTFIVSDDNLIYSEDGYYDTKKDKAKLQRNSYVQGKEQKLKGDTIFYDRKIGMGEVFNNMEIHDTTNNIIIAGDYGFYNEITKYGLATKRAQMMQIYKEDTLYLHADTLQMIPLPEEESRMVKAFYNVKFFRKDMQGRCDSMVYDFRDSTNTFYHDPVIWAMDNQLTAQTIKLYTKNRALYKAEMLNSAFVISQEDSLFYNQVKGRNMTGYIRNNEIYRIDVDGNGQTVYYPKDKDIVIGVNRAESSNLTIHLENKKITGIKLRVDPNGNINPPLLLPTEDVRLNGFHWLESIRPKNRLDIFKHVKMPEIENSSSAYDEYQFGDDKQKKK